jgi:6-pyruvoyltetrahydropterin/6-carboxytetrahydropterin synthase
MIAVTRRVVFCAGHRVFGHEGACWNFHGHNFVVELHAEAKGLDALGRIVDSSVLKGSIGGWIDEHWDHGFIVWSGDSEALSALAAIAGQRVFVLPSNPTAENLAAYLLEEVGPKQLAHSGAQLVKVVVHETENFSATASL